MDSGFSVFFEGAPSLGFLQGQGSFTDPADHREDALRFLPDGRVPKDSPQCQNGLHGAAWTRETHRSVRVLRRVWSKIGQKRQNGRQGNDQVGRGTADCSRQGGRLWAGPRGVTTSSQTAVGNRSLRPTKIATGSRNVRRAGSFRVMACTATPSPSGKGSETISNSSPYMWMWREIEYPSCLTLAQSFAGVRPLACFIGLLVSVRGRRGEELGADGTASTRRQVGFRCEPIFDRMVGDAPATLVELVSGKPDLLLQNSTDRPTLWHCVRFCQRLGLRRR